MTGGNARGGADRPHPIPRGLCQCGCGGATTVASKTSRQCGVIAGQHYRYIRGHACRKQADWVAIPHSSNPDVLMIPLTNGGYALVDEEDLGRVEGYRWYRQDASYTSYAVAQYRAGGPQKTILMHRLILGLAEGDSRQGDHRNLDGLDNRRRNLRRSSRYQNMANRPGRRDGASSRYKGVTASHGKWIAKILLKIRGVFRGIYLGQFDAEGDAAFAYSVAARLLRDPAFVRLVPIAEGDLPGEPRRREIEAATIGRLKRRLAGQKGKERPVSRFFGVTTFPKLKGKWKACIQEILVNGRSAGLTLGRFESQVEAAFAYNQAVLLLRGGRPPINRIPEAELPSPARREEIRGAVLARIAARKSGPPGGPPVTTWGKMAPRAD